MSKMNKKMKFILSLSVIFGLIGTTYLTVGLLKSSIPEGGVRNSTDEIGNRVLLSKAEFKNDALDEDWQSPVVAPNIINEVARFDSEEQALISPRLNNNFTKYVELSISEVSGGSDGAFLLSGYDINGQLLEEHLLMNIEHVQTYGYRFSYDHVFIDYVVFTYTAHEAVLAVDNIAIYALQ
ncbi:MAG: hypothetical protein PHT30_01665 [Bacilli bacterium]|nr:hypothetical protein [Bacilli bacterium]